MVGPADPRPNLFKVEQQGHVAVVAGEFPFPPHLAVEHQPDDILAHAEGAVGGLWDGDLALGRGLDRLGAVEQPDQEGVQVLGGELIGSTMVAPPRIRGTMMPARQSRSRCTRGALRYCLAPRTDRVASEACAANVEPR